MWEDIRAPQKFALNRALVKHIWEETLETEPQDAAVESIARKVERDILHRMSQNMSLDPLNLIIWEAIVEMTN